MIFFPTNKIDNLTCVIIHDNLTCVDYHEILFANPISLHQHQCRSNNIPTHV